MSEPYSAGQKVATACLFAGLVLAIFMLRNRNGHEQTIVQVQEIPKLEEPQFVKGKYTYWFRCTGDEYENRLEKFRTEHPELHLIGASPEVGSSMGGSVGNVGFHVYFEPVKPPEQAAK